MQESRKRIMRMAALLALLIAIPIFYRYGTVAATLFGLTLFDSLRFTHHCQLKPGRFAWRIQRSSATCWA